MMRFNIIDSNQTVTFLAPPHALKALAAGCSSGADSVADLLGSLTRYDPDLGRNLREQLAIFQEHNLGGATGWVHDRIDENPDYAPPVVVLDARTRELSQRPGELGLIVFNLPAKRIIQIQNTYANLERSDRGRIRRNGQPVRALYSYTLPDDWAIVP